jgi:hypothetical protein
MPIQIQMQDCIIDHIEMQVPTEDGKVGVRHMLGFTDKITGIRAAFIFTPEELEEAENGDIVLKKQPEPSDLLVAGPDAMPPGQPGPDRRPPMAGPGRPGR